VSEERARELVDSIEDLPTLPEVVIEITRLVENPDTTAEDIYKIASTDISLSATMLKLVNSAFYGMSRSITSLETAIRILGFATVRNIALAAFVFDAFLTGKGQFDYKAFWIHSIGTATASNILANRLRIKESGEHFVHGLLHDLGVVIYMQYLTDQFEQLRQLVSEGKPLGKAEIEVSGCTHGELGWALAERWDFPPALCNVIRYHGAVEVPEDFVREISVTSCANALVQALEIGEGVVFKVPVVHESAWKAAGVELGQIGDIMDDLLTDMERSRPFIDLLFR